MRTIVSMLCAPSATMPSPSSSSSWSSRYLQTWVGHQHRIGLVWIAGSNQHPMSGGSKASMPCGVCGGGTELGNPPFKKWPSNNVEGAVH